jgi:hypothetical protein
MAKLLAIFSGLLLLGLIVVSLMISTRTAILNKELEDLRKQDTALTDDVNKLWAEIGVVTAQQAMEQRARQAGFRPPDKTEYYAEPITVTAATPISTSVVISE